MQDEKDETSKFEISVDPGDDYSGRWAFKSIARGYFLGASADTLVCTARNPSDAELWFVHLASRPQVNLFSIGRKRFAHLSDDQREIHVEENVPWGEDTLFTLEFREEANKYSIHTCNNMYLQRDGKLVPAVNKVGLSYSLGKRNHLVKQGRRRLLQNGWARQKIIRIIVKCG